MANAVAAAVDAAAADADVDADTLWYYLALPLSLACLVLLGLPQLLFLAHDAALPSVLPHPGATWRNGDSVMIVMVVWW